MQDNKTVSYTDGILYIGQTRYDKNELLNYLRQMKKCFEVGERLATPSERKLKQMLVLADEERKDIWEAEETQIYITESGTSKQGNLYTKFIGNHKGEEVKISMNKLVEEIFDDPADKHKKKVKAAARRIIQTQIKKYTEKLDAWQVCWLTGTEINIEEDAYNVDHKVPFWKLFWAWLKQCGISEADIELDEMGQWINKDAEESWYNFHQEYAELKVATPKANKQKGGREYDTI